MGFLREFFVVLMLFPCHLYNLSMVFFFKFLLDFHGISMGLKSNENQFEHELQSIENKLKSLETQWKVH